MDSVQLEMYSQQLKNLPQDFYPLFDVCHVILCVLAVRKETGRGYAWKHPISAWISCMIASFAGSIICNPLLGKPILGAFNDEQMVLVSTGIFLAIFFSPGDIVYNFVKLVPVYVTICAVKEVLRAKKVYKGLQEGTDFVRHYNGSPFFIPLLIATLKGNGSAFAGPIVRFVRGDWQAGNQELIKPSVATKLCFFAALALTLLADLDVVYLAIVGLFVTVKLSGIFGETVDPFEPIEKAFWGLLRALSLNESVKND